MAATRQSTIKVSPETHAQLQALALSVSAEVGRVVPLGLLVHALTTSHNRAALLTELRALR